MLFTKQHTLLLLVTTLLAGCSGTHSTTPPSQNSALQSISPSKTASDDHEEYRIMQKNTNAWIDGEWTMFTESNTSAQEKRLEGIENPTGTAVQMQDQNSSFTLQHYVDKAELYLENKKEHDANLTKAPPHYEKVNAMPGIGKIDRR